MSKSMSLVLLILTSVYCVPKTFSLSSHITHHHHSRLSLDKVFCSGQSSLSSSGSTNAILSAGLDTCQFISKAGGVGGEFCLLDCQGQRECCSISLSPPPTYFSRIRTYFHFRFSPGSFAERRHRARSPTQYASQSGWVPITYGVHEHGHPALAHQPTVGSTARRMETAFSTARSHG